MSFTPSSWRSWLVVFLPLLWLGPFGLYFPVVMFDRIPLVSLRLDGGWFELWFSSSCRRYVPSIFWSWSSRIVTSPFVFHSFDIDMRSTPSSAASMALSSGVSSINIYSISMSSCEFSSSLLLWPKPLSSCSMFFVVFPSSLASSSIRLLSNVCPCKLFRTSN